MRSDQIMKEIYPVVQSTTAAMPARRNFIGSGMNNIIGNSRYSSIIGGPYNVIPAGFSNVHIAGSNINAVANNTLHVNNMWVDAATLLSFAGFPAPFPPGTIYVDTTAGSGRLLRIA